MGAPSLKYLQSYVNESLSSIGLGEWEVNVTFKAKSDEDQGTNLLVYARIDANERYRTAELTLFGAFFDLTPFEQKRTLAHELTHLWTARLSEVAEQAKKDLHPEKKKIWWENFDAAEEYAVEQISRLVVHAMPRYKAA